MKSNTIWALITGLAVGFLVGREMNRSGGGGDSKSATATNKAGPTEIPKDWLTEKDLNAVDQFKDMTPQQKYAALKVLNERACDCGCPHGSTIKCKKEDPGCPRAPTVVTEVGSFLDFAGAVFFAKPYETPESLARIIVEASEKRDSLDFDGVMERFSMSAFHQRFKALLLEEGQGKVRALNSTLRSVTDINRQRPALSRPL
jgi:hypothetical protein